MKKINILERIFRYTSIRELSLIGHNISNIRNISSLFKLKKLNLSWNSITDFTPLTKIVDLETIILNNNKIDSIPSTIKNLKHLRFLGIRSNKIKDYEEYKKLTNNITLVSLDISNNPFGREENDQLYIIFTLPQIQVVNRQEITQYMRDNANKLYSSETIQQNNQKDFNLQQKYEDLQQQLSIFQDKLKQTQSKLDTANETIRNNQEQNNDYQRLSKLLRSTQAEREKLASELSVLRSESMTLKEMLTQLQEENSEISDEETNSPEYVKVKILKKKLHDSDVMQRTIAKNAHKEIKKINSEKQQLLNTINDLEMFKADALRTIAALNLNNKNLKSDLENTRKELETKNEAFLEEFAKMRILLGDQYNHLSSISIENEERLKGELKNKNEMYNLESAIQKIKSERDSAQLRLADLNDSHAEEKQAIIEKFSLKSKQQQYLIDELKSKLNESENKNNKIQKEKERLERKLARLFDVYGKLKEMRDNELHETQKTNDEMQSIQKELKENEEKMKRIQMSKQTDDEIFNTLARKHKDMEKKYNQLLNADSANKMLIKNIEAHEKLITEREKKIDNLEAERDKLSDENEKLRQENFKMQAKIQELTDVEKAGRQNIAILEDKNKSNEETIENLRNELKNKTKALDEIGSKLQTSNTDNIKLIGENKIQNAKLAQLKSDLAEIKDLTDSPKFSSLNNFEKVSQFLNKFNDVLNAIGLEDISPFIKNPRMKLDLYPDKTVQVESESETLLQKQRRILNAVRKELTTFPNVGNFMQPTEDDIEGQLDQLHKLVAIIKALFEQREKNITEMSKVVASQHRAVMAMSQRPSMSTIAESESNLSRAKSIIENDSKLNN
ncbi:Leucine Rich Repeat family protein [Trichomonas vaginalis G3]|uniref:Leucine-rich repeat-containing protein 46 n=1 Tax=Trichomonas vaginalis (strain ATCC PRA-98 / G3) TaxID=412133 RepID=A2G1I9_TRIV3|nr:uncharacterized protein TVAGG3_0825200 [Trichomonas vaginalis G3]EAX88983.1 Leucine Rich Repeat family protein [Trichomonas vaginalis G3]KAI5498171.1 biological adhesion protein [Trichomonas vaginalis G3]|eukprot:XP_001301913.1 hypothetical protein [Trichomonas vaginalis G3]